MDDLISRQAAIRFIRDKVSLSMFMKRSVDKADKACMELCDMLDRDLPSAQPEIIRCKDCKYFEYDHPYIIQGIPVLGHEVCNAWGDGCKTDENGYCFMAERRAEKEEVTA